MNRMIRLGLVAAGLGGLVLAVAFYQQWSWTQEFWPWSGGYYGRGNLSNLSFYFVSSILAAISLPNIWVGLTGEFAALTGGAIDLVISFSGIGVYMFLGYGSTENGRLLTGSLVALAEVGLAVLIFLWVRRLPFRDQRPMPLPLRAAFAFFAVTLIIVGGLLVTKQPDIFPWPLRAEVSVVYGWVFLGASAYFVHALFVPKWANACGQLLGFLAYDLVLILPFIDHFDTVRPEHERSLIVYTAVVVLSGLLALYYLLVEPRTRLWRSRRVATEAVQVGLQG